MELFKDKVYESLDDISQMVEPYQWDLNEQLGQMPDEIIIDERLIRDAIDTGYICLYTSDILQDKANELGLESVAIAISEKSLLIYEFYDMVSEYIDDGITEKNSMSYDPVINKITGGHIKLVKKKMAFEDRDIEDRMINDLENSLLRSFCTVSSVNKSRINEIADLFGAKDVISERKARLKVRKLINRYKNLIRERELNIRDFKLMERFVRWNILYIKDGKLPALSNITKVKIMMRSKLPIYSIVEDDV